LCALIVRNHGAEAAGVEKQLEHTHKVTNNQLKDAR
jgi:hypothetical protein